jgi:hypothetical protein
MSYREVLEVPGAARLFASSVIGRMPLGTSTISLVLFVHSVRGAFGDVGIVVAAFTLSGAAAAPVQGGLVDRLGTTRVLGVCGIGSTAGLVATLIAGLGHAPLWVLVVFAVLAGALLPPIESVARAIWPHVAPDVATREAGYALDAVSQELIWTVGPLLVALAVAAIAPSAAMLMTAALTLGGAALFMTSPLVRGYEPAAQAERETPRTPRRGAMLRLVVPIALMGFGIGACDVGLPALADDLGAPALGALLIAFLSIGSIAGGLWYGVRSWRSDTEMRHGVLLVALGVMTVPLLFAGTVTAAVLLTLFAGLAWSPALANQFELGAKLATGSSAVSVFAWCTAAIDGGVALGSAAAGGMIDLTNARGAIAVALGGYLVSGALALALRSIRVRAKPAPLSAGTR